MSNQYSNRINEIIKISRDEAIRLGHNCIEPAHIMLAILKQGESMAIKMLKDLNVDVFALSAEIENSIANHNNNVHTVNISFTKHAEQVLQTANARAKAFRAEKVGSEHLLLALAECDADIAKLLANHGAPPNGISKSLSETLQGKSTQRPAVPFFVFDQQNSTHKNNSPKDRQKSKTPVLDNFSKDLTKLAQQNKLDPVIGRNDEIERLSQILSRRKKNNPVLIGEPGVGKTAIIEGLALRIVEKKVSRSLLDKRVLALDLAAIVAGTKYRGQFEERMRTILLELEKATDIILFIDEIHTLVGAGGASGSLDASNMFKPALARGEIQCIGATTINEYRQFIEKDGALERRFQKVLVEQPTAAETHQIIEKIKDRYEQHHKVVYSEDAIKSVVALADRYITDRMFPDKAIDVLDEAGARVHISNVIVPNKILEIEQEINDTRTKKNEVVMLQQYEEAAKYRDQERTLLAELEEAKQEWDKLIAENLLPVTEYDVSDVVAMMTGIPVNKIAENESNKLIRLADEMKKHIIGQDDAIDTVVRAIRRARAGLKNPNRPIGSFMFLGPTGVGKTELAKIISKMMFDKDDALIRMDMSEFMEKFAVSRLMGAPPGYIGYEEGGQLTEKIRKKPYSVILLDEIEKAHPDVFNILLQVFDDGTLTDSNGRKVDFKNTVIIMTSNAGTKDIKSGGKIGFNIDKQGSNYENIKSTIDDTVKQLFSPEFLNRVDEFVIFNPLTKQHIHKIIDINLQELIDRLQATNNISFDISEAAKDFIANEGFDEKFGARPLRRQIQKCIEDPLAEEILKGTLQPYTKILADFDDVLQKIWFETIEEINPMETIDSINIEPNEDKDDDIDDAKNKMIIAY